MSGHSKWNNIKRKKEKTDAQKAKVFTKIGREISVAVREGGADPANNGKLRDLIAKAKASNVPNDNIDRIIKKAAGEGDKNTYFEMVYEGYGPCGVAVIVDVLTDNRNRTTAAMKHAFDKFGGNLGAPGCVSYMFEQKGLITIEKTDAIDEDALMEAALEAGADDMIVFDDSFEIQTAPDTFNEVNDAIKAAGYEVLDADVEYVPSMESTPTDADVIKNLKKMIDMLEDNDDVQKVYTNCTIDLYE